MGSEGLVYLGCRQMVSSVKLPSGRLATTMTYAMEDCFGSCIQQNLDLSGPKTILRKDDTPWVAADHKESPAGAPGVGPVTECPGVDTAPHLEVF